MNRLFLLLTIVATFSVASFSQSYHYDVDGNGVVTAADVTALYDYLLGNVQLQTYCYDVDANGVVTAADITALYDYLLGNVPEVNYEWVDLGLPSGTLWATMNVGASSPEDYGDYFAWGETEPKEWYAWSNYKWCNGTENTLTKYCTKNSFGYNGFVDNKSELDIEDDPAYVNWGPEWRMPSLEQIEELHDNCTLVWTKLNGVKGRLFTASNGASLFLPAAGFRWEGTLYSTDYSGYYWSRTLDITAPYYTYCIYFNSGVVYWDGSNREYGYSVRAVRVVQN